MASLTYKLASHIHTDARCRSQSSREVSSPAHQNDQTSTSPPFCPILGQFLYNLQPMKNLDNTQSNVHPGASTDTSNNDIVLSVQQVAFSAALVASGEVTLVPSNRDVTMIFKHVVTNIGNAYNPQTGVFTAPVRGAYHFEWHIGDVEGPTAAALVKNSERVFSAYASLAPGLYGTSSESATLQLDAGDVVSVNHISVGIFQEKQIF
uniref:C1q domain-containing protein n=1 Tax=Monopterus albus TaxID=43700 RepID=A0A3Q3KEG8_MONAL